MKLYIRQKVFSIGDRFTVKDADGNDRYYVEGEVFTFGSKLHVYDMSGRPYIGKNCVTLYGAVFLVPAGYGGYA